MKVRLNRDRCQGHGRCYVLAPAVFEPDDDGYGYVINEDVASDFEDGAHKGVNNCPEDAIVIIES